MSHPAAALDVLVPDAIALAWSFEPAVVVPVVAAATLYLRGWAVLRPRMPERFGAGARRRSRRDSASCSWRSARRSTRSATGCSRRTWSSTCC
jgi:hypothetical protein